MTSYPGTPPNQSSTCELLVKLLARILDPAAHDGEAQNAGQKLVTIARRDGVTLPIFSNHFAAAAKVLPAPRPAESDRPFGCSLVMTNGKYEGLTLLQVGQRDLNYLRWVAREYRDEIIRDGAMQVLKYLKGRAAA